MGGNAANKNILCNLAAVTGNTSAFAFSSASGLANLTVQAIQCVTRRRWHCARGCGRGVLTWHTRCGGCFPMQLQRRL